MTETATTNRLDTPTLVVLLLVNTVTVAAVYALVLPNDFRNSLAAALLVSMIVAQTFRYRPRLTILSWVSTIPVAIVMAILIVTYPALDWAGPGEADEMSFPPIYPVITVFYAIGFTLVAGAAHWAGSALRNRHSRKSR